MASWNQYFTGLVWSNGTPGDGYLIANDSSPEEIVMWRVWLNLFQNAKMQEIFGEKIEANPIRPAFDFRNLPRLQVYLGSLSEEQVPTQLDVNSIVVHVGIRESLENGVRRLEPGENTAAAAMRVIRTVLKSDDQLTTQVHPTNPFVPLAARSQQESGLEYLVDESDAADLPVMTTQLQYVYQVDVTYPQGQINNYVKGGGA